MCGGADHAIGIDCKGEKEDIICITVVDNVRSICMSAMRVGVGSASEFVEFINEMVGSTD